MVPARSALEIYGRVEKQLASVPATLLAETHLKAGDLKAAQTAASHNEIEDAKPADLTAGCNVLLNAVLECANAGSPMGNTG
jgi:hypothetical protein